MVPSENSGENEMKCFLKTRTISLPTDVEQDVLNGCHRGSSCGQEEFFSSLDNTTFASVTLEETVMFLAVANLSGYCKVRLLEVDLGIRNFGSA